MLMIKVYEIMLMIKVYDLINIKDKYNEKSIKILKIIFNIIK